MVYRLNLPITAKLHNVFHVSKLKRFIGDPTGDIHPLPEEFINQQPLLTPSAILKYRDIIKRAKFFPRFWSNGVISPQLMPPGKISGIFMQNFPILPLRTRVLKRPGQLLQAQGLKMMPRLLGGASAAAKESEVDSSKISCQNEEE